MKKYSLFILAVLSLLLLTGCCEHEWQEANCLQPATCALCGKTEGEIGDHVWVEATCTEPRTCSVCGLTEGEALGHVWESDDCHICTVCGLDDRSVDDQFMDALAEGLEARWSMTDTTDASTALKADWESYFNAEYDCIIDFKDADFENEELGQYAKAYINSIIASKEALAYFGTNQWVSKYTNGIYHERSMALYNIHAICPVPISDDNQGNLLGLISDGEVNVWVSPLLESLTFECTENSYGYKTYQAVIENETSQLFSYFAFDIDLIDSDGVTVETDYSFVDNWEPGENIRFEFYTSEDFAEMKVVSAEWSF